ncbi:hypothetical protein KY290_001336 [Solanum tuberosum]|uniref:Uncharacterized protein n=1 Tax=Solanum tuberosum TaxID=4113 RepID=A0ABQ7WNU4_SOLTU|nr:hypothetical protein KY290_001336 [Solanum tuberosum]
MKLGEIRHMLLEEEEHWKVPSVSPRWASRTVVPTMGRETPRGPHLTKERLHWVGSRWSSRTVVHSTDSEAICDPSQYIVPHIHYTDLCSRGPSRTVVPTTAHLGSRIMAPRRNNAAPHSSPTASQSDSDNTMKSSSSEIPYCESHSPEHSFQSEEEGDSSGSGEKSGIGPGAATGAQAEAGAEEEDDDVTQDDTMVQYVHLHEFDIVVRHQLIHYFRSMWTVNRSKDFFKNGIVNKSNNFKNRPLIPETRVVMADNQAFPDIYILFQLHQFEWMNNALGEFTGHLP